MTDDRDPENMNDQPEGSEPPESPEAVAQKEPPATPTRPGSTKWLVVAIILTIGFLVPVLMLMRPAAQPSARAAHAAKHGFIQLDNEEGALLYQAQLFSEGRGRDLYHDLEQPPYVVATYTPLYMAAVGLTDSFNPVSFRAGRILVWCAAMGIGMLLVILVSMITRNAPVGVLTGFLFLATWEVHRWIGYFRVDFPAIFLSLAGLATVVLGAGKRPALALGALLMVAGLYTKQTVIAAPVACLAALFFHQRKLRAVELAGWLLLWGLPPMLLLNLWTEGRFFQHAFVYNINTWHEFNLQVWSRHVWFMHRWILIAAAVALPVVLYLCTHAVRLRGVSGVDSVGGDAPVVRQPQLFHFWQPVAWYAVLAQWNFVAIAKGGSAENYLLEPLAGISLLIGLAAGAALRATATPAPVSGAGRLVAAISATALLALVTLHAKVVTHPGSYESRFNPMIHVGRPDFEAAQLVQQRMREAMNPLSELAIYHLQNDQPPVFQPFIVSELARQGLWDQKPFVRSIEAAEYDVVIMLDDVTESADTQKYTPEMLAAFHSAYKLEVTYSTPTWTYYILVPKDEDDQPTAAEFAAASF